MWTISEENLGQSPLGTHLDMDRNAKKEAWASKAEHQEGSHEACCIIGRHPRNHGQHGAL